MSDFIIDFIIGIGGAIIGSICTLLTKRYLQKRREFYSTKRKQLKFIFAPLEILIKINGIEFERYFEKKTTIHDREFIEKQIWYPNHIKIKKILTDNSHLLEELPDIFLKLLRHINVWLSEYELIYVKKEKDSPVFGGPKGYSYPTAVDDYIIKETAKLRKMLSK